MLRKFVPIVAIAALLAMVPAVAPSLAAPAALPGFNEGVAAYNARRYSQAVSYFSQALKVSPSDPTTHYWLALAYQGMNQMTLAKQHFAYVAQCGSNRALAAQASLALNNLGRYQTARAGSLAPTTTRVASAAGGGAQSSLKANGKLKVVEFSTDW